MATLKYKYVPSILSSAGAAELIIRGREHVSVQRNALLITGIRELKVEAADATSYTKKYKINVNKLWEVIRLANAANLRGLSGLFKYRLVGPDWVVLGHSILLLRIKTSDNDDALTVSKNRYKTKIPLVE